MGTRNPYSSYLRYPPIPAELLARSGTGSRNSFVPAVTTDVAGFGDSKATGAVVPWCLGVSAGALLDEAWRSHYAALRSARRCM